MKFKLDENLGGNVGTYLKEAGYNVMTVWEQQLNSAPDTKVIEICHKEERCLVTLDLDFANPFRFRPNEYSGIVIFRLPPRGGMAEMVAVAHILVQALRHASPEGKLWIVKMTGVREYQP